MDSTTTAKLTLSGHSTAWWLKREKPTSPTCVSKGTTTYTHDLVGLTSGVSYKYAAYSDSGCSTELASATFKTSAAYALSAETITIAAGSTSATVTLTAINDRLNGNNDVNLATDSTGATANAPVEIASAASPTLTITDDDSLTAPASLTGVIDTLKPTEIALSWDEITAAASYKLQYKRDDENAWSSEISVQTSACQLKVNKRVCDYTLTGLTHGQALQRSRLGNPYRRRR